MPLLKRAKNHLRNFNIPVSYKGNVKGKMRDSKNVFTNQDILETRHGISRFNSTALDNAPDSLTYFKDNSGNRILLVKDGAKLRKVAASGAHTDVATGLTSGQKHRAITLNGRHIIAMGTDGLKAWDGTTYTQLGQAPPTAPTAAVSGSGNTLSASTYQVAVTFYSSVYGFETNIGSASATVTVTGTGEQIDVTNIPSSAANGFIDKVIIYLKDVGNAGDWLFWDELNLGTTSDTIDDDPTSTQTPPTKNGAPIAGGGKYLALFGNRIAYAGNSTFPNDVFLSEPHLPDAFDDTATGTILNAAGGGGVTGLGVGRFNDSHLDPYLVYFTETSVEIYSEIGGVARVALLSDTLGCVAPESIVTIAGDVYFMSNKGWHVVENGSMLKRNGKPIPLAERDIDDIFTREGYTYQLNAANFDNFFSVYYPTFEHYLTFISEGSSTDISKAYNYEFQIGGFRPYQFPVTFKCGAVGVNANGKDVVYLGGEGGYIYTHSIEEDRNDVDNAGSAENIDVFAQLFWWSGEDLDCTYNFGPLILKALAQSEAITVKCLLDWDLQTPIDKSFDLSSDEVGFILDVSKLDEGILGDGRTIVQYNGEVMRTAKSLLIGFYQNVADGNISLMEMQMDVSKNGGPSQ